MTIKRLLLASPLVWVVVLVMACNGPSPNSTGTPTQPPPAARAEWTVLVYQVADNNLEWDGLKDLEEMASVGSSDKVRIVAQSDRRQDAEVTEGVLGLPDWTTAKRLYVEKGALRELGDVGEVNSDDPKVLQEFIQWAVRAYPAQRYALVLWDHGGAFKGFGGDETAGKGSIMRLPALAGALKGSGVKFEFLGFDACLMASTEVALELMPYAKFLAVSEEVEPGPGWDYSGLLSALQQNPRMDGQALGKAVADSYLAFYKKYSPAEALYATFSVINLGEMSQVASALSGFSAELNRYVMADTEGKVAERLLRLGQVVGQARWETPGFYRSDFTSPGLVFDLGLLGENVARVTKDQRIAQKAADLRAAIAKAVPYSVTGDGFRDTKLSGLSLHLPVFTSAFNVWEPYSQLTGIRGTQWQEFISALANTGNQDKTSPVVTQPQIDVAEVIPERNKATVTGSVTDETLVTGVVVGTTGIIGQTTVLFGLEEQRRTYSTTNGYSYVFDGMGWYLDDGSKAQPVFTVQWRPGQRAVFGLYQEDKDYEPETAYLIYDEATGEFVQGFNTGGDWIGAVVPRAGSVFLPFLYSPSQEPLDITEPVLVKDTRLKKGPLPAGEYVLTVTGFDLGDNAATGAVLVRVRKEQGEPGPGAVNCQPGDVDAASSLGEHNARFDLPSMGSLALGLLVDRTQVGQVRYDLNVQGGDQKVELRLIGPDGETVGASGTVDAIAYDYFTPELSGLYQLQIEDRTGGPKTLFLTWSLRGRPGVQFPNPIDLDRSPALVSQLEQPGLHTASLTVPAGQTLNLSLALDPATTPWVGYTITVIQGPQSLPMGVLDPTDQVLDETLLCGPHMGGFQVAQIGEYSFLFDNRQSAQDQVLLISLEGYSPDTPPQQEVTSQRLEGWCTGDHSQDFILPPGGGLLLFIPCDSTQAAGLAFNLTTVAGVSPLEYYVVAPDGGILVTGVHEHIVQEQFAIEATGEYVIALDNSANVAGKTVKLTTSVQARTGPPPGPAPTATPTPVQGGAPGPTPSPTPTPGPTVYHLPEFATGDHAREFTLGPRQVVKLVIPLDSQVSASAGVALSQGGEVVNYRIEDPSGQVLARGTFGYLTQETVSINTTGDYSLWLENTSASSRTVRVTVSVQAR